MARRLIGLDVGTNAVTIAEVTPGTPPRLDMFAQVALPREAMREGEVADEAAVADAVARLRDEVGLKKTPVRVGIASPRVVVRQVEMPVMTRDELASALKFQASDLIPISMDDAVLDFAILGTPTHSTAPVGDDGFGGEPVMQVLLAAAQEATILRLVSAVESGGLQVAAVDLIPLALTRALARPVPAMAPAAGGGIALADEVGAEGIVSFGGGVTSIAVHENGVPRFVRVLGTGGRELTDAIANDLGVPVETAEALKRAIGTQTNDEMVTRARTAMDRPLSVLLDEVRSSLDYFRNQPGASRLQRVIVTGGSAQMPGLPERLSALTGTQVEPAYMHDLLRVGDIGFSHDELPRLEPYLPAAVGLALGGANVGTVVNLQPTARRTKTKSRPTIPPKVLAGVVGAVVLLGGATYFEHSKASSAKSDRANAEAEVARLQSELTRLTSASSPTGQASLLQRQAAQLLGTDVGWPDAVHDLATALPGGVRLTTFQAQRDLASKATVTGVTGGAGASGAAGAAPSSAAPSASAGASTAANAGTTSTGSGATAGATIGNGSCASYQAPITGAVTMAGFAPDLPALASFLDGLAKLGGSKNPDFSTVTLGAVQKSSVGETEVVAFTVNATLGSGVRSDRLQHYFKGALCK